VWVGGTVFNNPAYSTSDGYGASNDQKFVRLAGMRCFGTNCRSRSVESVVGGDYIDFFYWQLTPSASAPPPIRGTTFGYPFDLGEDADKATQQFAQTLQLCANRAALQTPLQLLAPNPPSPLPNPAFGLANCSYNAVKSRAAGGVSGSPFLTNDGPLSDAVGGVDSGTVPDGNRFDAFSGVPGLFGALTYLQAEGITSP
jgi:hypothetical protein